MRLPQTNCKLETGYSRARAHSTMTGRKIHMGSYPAQKQRKVGSSLVLAALAVATLSGGAAKAEVDLGGYYTTIFDEDLEERGPGPDAGDYIAMPINSAARLRGETWNASLLTMPERQCIPHPSTYGMRGIGNLHLWSVRDPATQRLIKYEQHIDWEAQNREIWMDDRPFPPEWALRTWQGFSKGHWEADTLVVETRNLKPGWIRRNGLALSDKARMTERYYRHENVLHHVMIVEDPVYLTEPLVRTNVWREQAVPRINAYPCRPAVEIVREDGVVPHNPFRQTADMEEFAKRWNLPMEAVRGGAGTALPEFMDVLSAYRASHPSDIAKTKLDGGEPR